MGQPLVADDVIQNFADQSYQMEQTQNADYGTPGDEKLIVKFESYPHLNDSKSREEGRPRFEMTDYVRIMIPGDKDSVVVRPVREGDKVRFSKAWERYKAGQSQITGTPLSEWNKVTRAQVEELAYFHIRTIEDLANVNDSQTHKFMGIHGLREIARKHLELLKEQAPLDKVQAELAQRDEQLSAMQAQNATMQAQLQELMREREERRAKEAA